jgi:hypothetical protein
MRVTGSTGIALSSGDQKLRQIERLVSSSVLSGSESLCRLLRYLAEHELSGSSATEYQIATEVFSRPANFEPGLDSTVRVQSGRLRLKLAEYYAQDGAGDPLIVELPKGSYAVTFRYRAPLEGRLTNSIAALEGPVLAPLRSKQREHWVAFLVVAITLALISAAALGYLLATQDDVVGTPLSAERDSSVL